MLKALRASSPKYNEAIRFILVDWDTYKNDAIARDYNVRNRSTLIMLKGGQELGRVSFSSSRGAIEPLFEAAI